MNYAESDDNGDDDEVFQPISGNRANKDRSRKRRRISLEDSEDEFGADAAVLENLSEDGEYFHERTMRTGLLVSHQLLQT